MRVLLIQPTVSDTLGLRRIAQLEPLGLEYVAASLLHDNSVELFDARFETDLEAKLRSHQPDAVGIAAAFTADVNHVRHTIRSVRSVAPQARIFVGGHHVTMVPKEFASEVEATVVGEGEVSARELLEAWEAGRDVVQVPGVLTTASPALAGDCRTPLADDLDNLPHPARHLVRRLSHRYHYHNWRPCATLETLRGCPYRCRFCSVWKFYQGRVRARSIESVIDELAEIEVPFVVIADDNLFADAERALAMAEEIARSGERKSFLVHVRTDAVVKHTELVPAWVRAGLKVALVGYESFSQERLDQLNKHNSLETNEQAVQLLQRYGVQVLASFIVDPDFSREDFIALAQYVQHQQLTSPIFTVLTPLPGTDLFDQWQAQLGEVDWQLFDLQHAVLPTRLGLEDFYRQYSRLYLSAFLSPRSIVRLLTSGVPLNLLRALWTARRAIDPHNLLAAHNRNDTLSSA